MPPKVIVFVLAGVLLLTQVAALGRWLSLGPTIVPEAGVEDRAEAVVVGREIWIAPSAFLQGRGASPDLPLVSGPSDSHLLGVAPETGSDPPGTRLLWYDRLIHNAFGVRWRQPEGPGRGLRTRLRVWIGSDGSVVGYQIVESSGNEEMDASVLDAASKVSKIQPLPSAITEDIYEVFVTFVH